jgi:hypothetical protein
MSKLPRGIYMDTRFAQGGDAVLFEFSKLKRETLEALLADDGVPPEWRDDAQKELKSRGEQGDQVTADNPLVANAERRAARSEKRSNPLVANAERRAAAAAGNAG